MVCCSLGGTCQVKFSIKHGIQNSIVKDQRETNGPTAAVYDSESKCIHIEGVLVKSDGFSLVYPLTWGMRYDTIL